MIALLLAPVWWHSTCATFQPKQRKSLWRWLLPLFGLISEHSTTQANSSRRRFPFPPAVGGQGSDLRHLAEVSKTCCLPSSNSPDRAFHPPNTFPHDRLCHVCDIHCSSSCAVCEQHFCPKHLYVCLDCNNQYCSRCLDDHRADGHWSDSDTAAELTRGNSAAFLVRQVASIFTLNRLLSFCADHCCQADFSVISGESCSPLRSWSSQTGTQSLIVSLSLRISRSLCSCASLFSAGPILKLFSQSQLPAEVSL